MWLKQLLTETDNNTACLVRYSAAALLATYLAGALYDTVHTGSFNYAAFASSAWPMLLAIGGAVSGKAFVETKNATQE